jgi:hypothetical protein
MKLISKIILPIILCTLIPAQAMQNAQRVTQLWEGVADVSAGTETNKQLLNQLESYSNTIKGTAFFHLNSQPVYVGDQGEKYLSQFNINLNPDDLLLDIFVVNNPLDSNIPRPIDIKNRWGRSSSSTFGNMQFPRILPLHFFKNAKEGDIIQMTFNGTPIELQCQQQNNPCNFHETERFEDLLRAHLRNGYEKGPTWVFLPTNSEKILLEKGILQRNKEGQVVDGPNGYIAKMFRYKIKCYIGCVLGATALVATYFAAKSKLPLIHNVWRYLSSIHLFNRSRD